MKHVMNLKRTYINNIFYLAIVEISFICIIMVTDLEGTEKKKKIT